MLKTNKLMLLIAFTVFLGCPLVEKPNNIKPSSSSTPAITTTPSASASILDNQPSNNIKLEKFDGKLVFLSNEKPKDLEPNSLYFLDGDNPIPKKIFTFSQISRFNKFLISPDEKKVFILNVPSNQNADIYMLPSSNNLDLYIFDLDSNKLNKINLDKDIVLNKVSWFPNSRFLAIKDESNTIYVFDIDKNQITFEQKVGSIYSGEFILPELKLIKESDFVYFWSFSDQKYILYKIYINKVEKINEFKGISSYSKPNIINNSLLYNINKDDNLSLHKIDIYSLKRNDLLSYSNLKDIKEPSYQELSGFSNLDYFENLFTGEIFIIASFYSPTSGMVLKYKLFLFNPTNNKLTLLLKEPFIDLGSYKMISKSLLNYNSFRKNSLLNAFNIIDIYTLKKNESISDFFTDNLPDSNFKISSIYSN